MNLFEIAYQHTCKSFCAPNSFTSNALIGHYSSQKKAPVKTSSPLGKAAAAKQQDEACAADWKIIFFQVQAVYSSGWEPRAGNWLENQPPHKSTRSWTWRWVRVRRCLFHLFLLKSSWPGHLHCGDWGREVLLPSLLITQVNFVWLSTHG